jgi:DNA-binding MarR family transcriptional regulator
MSNDKDVPFAVTIEVRDTCLCLHLQRAARAVARRFDTALRPLDLTNGQFSLLMSLNRPEAPTIGSVSTLLAMDRTTLTANLKPLERRGLIEVAVDEADRRSRRLRLTRAGRTLLAAAVPVWRRTHAAVERALVRSDADGLRADLCALSEPARAEAPSLAGPPAAQPAGRGGAIGGTGSSRA